MGFFFLPPPKTGLFVTFLDFFAQFSLLRPFEPGNRTLSPRYVDCRPGSAWVRIKMVHLGLRWALRGASEGVWVGSVIWPSGHLGDS